jgi:hypothetical protein
MKKMNKKDSNLQGGGLDKGLKLAKPDKHVPADEDKAEGFVPPLETQHDQVVREEQEAVKGVMQAQEDDS